MFQVHSSASAAVRAADYNEDLTQCLSPTLKRGDLVAEVGCGTLSGTTNYLYDGPNLVQEIDSGGNLLARYTQGSKADEPLAEVRSGTTSYYEQDGLSSVSSLSNAVGALINTYVYDSFGKVVASTGTLTNPLRYTGREFDPETGIYGYRARYYDPGVGRFLSEDPLGFNAGINFFRYVNNSTPNATDPTGLWSTDAHHQIIWNALHPCGVSNSDIWQMQQGSDFADSFAFQGGEWSFMHSMSNGSADQSPADAQNQISQFVGEQMNNAREVYNAGGNDQSMFLFGLAMHPVMDQTSPAHTDSNGNPIPWCGLAPWSCSQLSEHGDSPWSIEDLDHLNRDPEAQELENFLIRNWFQALTGKKLECHDHDHCSN
jgi:RHS repeat-associated protein